MKNSSLVEILYNAHNLKQPISKERIPKNISKTDAYEVQHLITNKKVADNQDILLGYKISLTSEETQKLFQSTTPLYGALTKTSLADGIIELDKMNAPLIEVELMFIVNENLSTEDSDDAILRKTSIAPGLEVPDSRFTDWFPKISFGQVIADSAVAGNIIVGSPVEKITVDQLGEIKADLRLNGESISSGTSSEVLNNPVNAIKWLVDELAKSGRIIEKGMIISSGTFILPKVLQKGNYEANFDNVGKISLNVI
ncbi:2-keto-4-pentenoate hydratase [Virgibacillus sp. DJP39]|uniref:2-keto-4-pentenoate hydratase n=1 Tax=Virgibacillus sp. DJP39 TaxID=3409790 RepID=UPI003BB58D96